MKVINRAKVKIIEDVCGQIQEMYNSPNLSISVATISGKSTPHKHEKMEEIYFVLRGKGKIYIDDESSEIQTDDLVPIPKNKFHYIETESGDTIEVLVATHPEFDPSDVIKQMS